MDQRISLGLRPRGSRRVRVLGVKPNLEEYSQEDRDMIRSAGTILYPTPLYAQALSDAGKRVFPGPRHYYYLGDKIRQTTLFKTIGLPHPRTMCLYGRQAEKAPEIFGFPFIAKVPRGVGQGRGVYLVRDINVWNHYRSLNRVAYVQEYLPIKRDLRVVVMAGSLITAYWRVVPPGGFRSNLRQGGTIDFRNVPGEGVEFALEVVRRCGFDDVGLDVFPWRGRWLVLEANMHYGQEGLRLAGLRLPDIIDGLIKEGRL